MPMSQPSSTYTRFDFLADRPGLFRHQGYCPASAAAPFLSRPRRISTTRTPPFPSGSPSLNRPAPRPPAWIWLFTTHTGPPKLIARRSTRLANRRVRSRRHVGTATPNFSQQASWPDIRGYSYGHATCAFCSWRCSLPVLSKHLLRHAAGFRAAGFLPAGSPGRPQVILTAAALAAGFFAFAGCHSSWPHHVPSSSPMAVSVFT